LGTDAEEVGAEGEGELGLEVQAEEHLQEKGKGKGTEAERVSGERDPFGRSDTLLASLLP
jgi:hypothetical protein